MLAGHVVQVKKDFHVQMKCKVSHLWCPHVSTGALPARAREDIHIWDPECTRLNGVGVLQNTGTQGGGSGGIRGRTAGGLTGLEMSGGASGSTKVNQQGGIATMFAVFECVQEYWV